MDVSIWSRHMFGVDGGFREAASRFSLSEGELDHAYRTRPRYGRFLGRTVGRLFSSSASRRHIHTATAFNNAIQVTGRETLAASAKASSLCADAAALECPPFSYWFFRANWGFRQPYRIIPPSDFGLSSIRRSIPSRRFSQPVGAPHEDPDIPKIRAEADPRLSVNAF